MRYRLTVEFDLNVTDLNTKDPQKIFKTWTKMYLFRGKPKFGVRTERLVVHKIEKLTKEERTENDTLSTGI